MAAEGKVQLLPLCPWEHLPWTEGTLCYSEGNKGKDCPQEISSRRFFFFVFFFPSLEDSPHPLIFVPHKIFIPDLSYRKNKILIHLHIYLSHKVMCDLALHIVNQSAKVLFLLPRLIFFTRSCVVDISCFLHFISWETWAHRYFIDCVCVCTYIYVFIYMLQR